MDPTQLPLRDNHLPEAISWWPPAVGWWLVPLTTMLLCALLFWLWRRATRQTVKKVALRQLNALQQNPQLTASERIVALSELLRRISISAWPRSDSAGLTGDAWLTFLDQPLTKPRFSDGPGRLLIEAPYRPIDTTRAEFDALFALCREWSAALPKKNMT